MELLVTVTVLAVVVTGVCDIFVANQQAWDRQSGKASTLMATSAALSSVGSYASEAVQTQVFSRFSTGDALAVTLPADSAYGFHVPLHEYNEEYGDEPWNYQPGQTLVVFYLSDSTGSYANNGDILWAGTMPSGEIPSVDNVTPDQDWSLYPGTTNGRTASIESIQFEEPLGHKYRSLKITVASSYKAGSGTALVTRTRTICLRSQLY